MATDESDGVQSDQTTLREPPLSKPSLSPPSEPSEPSDSKVSRSRKLWLKIRISPRGVRNMFKLSLPSVICIALFQSDFIANYFTTNGYINALIALAIVPILPRARFIQVLLQSIFSVCLAAALGLLALWCGTQARLHTTNPALPPEKYNSSQAVILGVWLFFIIWFANTVRSAYPLLMMPAFLGQIYTIVVCTSGVSLANMPAALEFTNKLLVNFLLGMSVATGVSLFIFPLTCRTVFFEATTEYLSAISKAVNTQQAYLRSIQDEDPWHSSSQSSANHELLAHKKTLEGVYGAAAKMRGELEYAAKEIAFGKLDAHHMSKISEWALRIMPAFSGLGFIYDILSHLYEDAESSQEAVNEKTMHTEWQTIMQALSAPIADLSAAMNLAIEHILLTLQLKKRVEGESTAQNPTPGSPEFLAWYNEQTIKFTQTREIVAQLWFEKEGVELPEDFFREGHKVDEKFSINETLLAARRKPFTIIYIQFLLYSASREIFDLVTLIDSLAASGIMSKRRFIAPSSKHLRKWASQLFGGDKTSDARLSPQHDTVSYNNAGTPPRSNPQKKVKNDPEHLPAAGWWEIVGNYIRLFPKVMRSAHASHGVRVACAIMSVAIGFYIKTSSTWFSRNRWLWAMFAIVLSMNRTAGLSVFQFFCRIGGTAVAMCASYAVWYMVDGHTVGVLIMLWVAVLMFSYLMVRFPFYFPAVLVAVMAMIVMVGNELQDHKIGFARTSALGQAAHDEYLMAPERLAIVSAGIGIGFFWTIFPYPLSEHTELREDLASTLYYLASLHSMTAKTVMARAKGLHPHMATRNDNDISHARLKVFTKLQFLFGRLKQHLKFVKFQVILGGKFPTAQYAELVSLCEKICTATNVIGYASTSFVKAWEDTHSPTPSGGQPRSESRWLSEFRSLLGTIDLASDEVISALVMFSNHLSAASPFAPYVQPPEANKLIKMIDEMRGSMLTVSHIMEPGYAAFVTMTMAGRGINKALVRQLEICKELLGVLDFSDLAHIDMEKGGSLLDEEEEAEEMGPAGL